MDIYIPSHDIVALYKIVPWDEPNEYYFATYLNAIQYGNENFGLRYDIVEL